MPSSCGLAADNLSKGWLKTMVLFPIMHKLFFGFKNVCGLNSSFGTVFPKLVLRFSETFQHYSNLFFATYTRFNKLTTNRANNLLKDY
ncbi:MAG: hypothetical protein UX30_C0001G0007 [Candidatus Saccharibacteria bacterium GW2011_GWA2_46_10]|nr:MAG: hypothetical protein UX30_C0001G0007 [Candidatus Saccharibacteria bacterium GW2011_GWA2_46_10]